jgi:GDP-L-fucose synthase
MNNIDKTLKVYLAGHRGLAGTAILKHLNNTGYSNIIYQTSSELDLTDTDKVFQYFKKEKPSWVILTAAKVGGIYAHVKYPVDFLLENLKIQNNIIEAAHKYRTPKLLFLGSSCIYPKLPPQPIKEEYLLTSPLEKTNETYAIAKIAGIKLCNAMNKQHNTNFICAMPTNLYGINDNYHKEKAHVIPMLIRRFHKAKTNNLKEIEIWGTGTPKREFLLSDDLAQACIFIMENIDSKDIGEVINIGSGKECTILELAALIKETVGFKGKIILDLSKPDGTPRKLLDVSKLKKLGWESKTKLVDGLKIAYKDFLENPDTRL